MTDDLLNYYAEDFIRLNVRSRLNLTFEQFLINPTDEELVIICRELGISTHKDLGIFNGQYCEVVTIGSHVKHINTPVYMIDKDNEHESRFKFLKKAIKAFKHELKTKATLTCH